MNHKRSLWLGSGGLLLAMLIIIAASEWPEEEDVPLAPALIPASHGSMIVSADPPEALPPVKNAARPEDIKPVEKRLSLAGRLAELARMVDGKADPAAFESFLGNWLATIHPGEMPEALAYVQNAGFEEPIAEEIETRLVRQWTGQNAIAAWQWAQRAPAGPLRDLDLESVAITRSELDLAAATAWAHQLPEGADRDRIVAAVVNEALRTEPVQALQLADNLPATPANDDLIRRAAMEWTSQDPPKALQWAKQLPDATFRAQVLSGVAVAWSEQDPIAAGRMVLKEIPAGRPQEDALVSIAQRWAQQSPEATARWIDGFPSGDLKRAAVESVAAIWSQNDPDAAAGWKTAAASDNRP